MVKWLHRIAVIMLVVLAVSMVASAQGGSIDIGTPVHGKASTQVVEYTLTMDAGQTVSITLESDEFDAYLELYDSGGTLLDSNDDNEGTNSRVIFTAQNDGQYNIRVRSFSNDYPEGAYTLTVEAMDVIGQLDGGRLSYDQPVTTDASSALSVVYTFKGSPGEVVDLIVVDDAEDTKMILRSPDGIDLMENDDGGTGTNPAILRYELPQSGTYTVVVTTYAEDEPMTGAIQMVVNSSELLMLNEGPQQVVLGSDRDQDQVYLDVNAGVDYLVTITAPVVLDTSIYVNALNANEDYGSTSINASGTRSFSFIFQPSQSGRATLALEVYSSGDVYELTVEAQAME